MQTCTATRDKSGWITVSLDGEVVWRHFTRDPAFTRFWVLWPSSGSPVRHTRRGFHGVRLGGAWRPRTRGYGSISGGVEFALPAMGETLTWRRLPDAERTAANPWPRAGGWLLIPEAVLGCPA